MASRPERSNLELEPSSPPTLARGLMPASSVMHAHLGYVILAEAHRFQGPELRLLDCGCGEGRFLELAATHVNDRLSARVEPWGFDVHDDNIQVAGFMKRAADRLGAVCPRVPWEERLHLVSQTEPWPYDDDFFDVIVSNQVGEHLEDLDAFLAEVARTLRPGGISVHLFPLRDYILEGHAGVPFLHRIESHDAMVQYLRSFGRSGLARFGPLRRRPSLTLEEYAESRADAIAFHTWYRRLSDVALAAKHARLRMSYRYTPELYALKLGYLLGIDVERIYHRQRHPISERLLFAVAKRISSVTFFFEKANTHDPTRL